MDNSVISILISCMEITDKFLSMDGISKKQLVMQQLSGSIGEIRYKKIGDDVINDIIDMICTLTKNSDYLNINSVKFRFCCPFV